MSDHRFIFYRADVMDGEADRERSWDWSETFEALFPCEERNAGPDEEAADGEPDEEILISDEGSAEDLASVLVGFASRFELSGNLWTQWLTYILMTYENPFSLACERRAIDASSTMMRLAKKDFGIFMELFRLDFRTVCDEEGAELLELLKDYRPPYEIGVKSRAGELIASLAGRLETANSADEFAEIVTDHYENNGTGCFGLYRAFRIEEEDGELNILPVTDAKDVSFDELIGYEDQKQTLRANTEAFLKGGYANNVLLYGDSGTGKSTGIHALMHDYADRGLRLIEISKSDRASIPKLLSMIKKRNYRVILFLDDLSFEEDESDYKELKAMLEGTLESQNDKVLIYATSNRRHLIRETWADRSDIEHDGDIHRSDTMEEKLSLAGRFGVRIYYPKPDYKEYMHIVESLADREGLETGADELRDEARKWSLRHGSTSGRTASQLIAWLKR